MLLTNRRPTVPCVMALSHLASLALTHRQHERRARLLPTLARLDCPVSAQGGREYDCDPLFLSLSSPPFAGSHHGLLGHASHACASTWRTLHTLTGLPPAPALSAFFSSQTTHPPVSRFIMMTRGVGCSRATGNLAQSLAFPSPPPLVVSLLSKTAANWHLICHIWHKEPGTRRHTRTCCSVSHATVGPASSFFVIFPHLVVPESFWPEVVDKVEGKA